MPKQTLNSKLVEDAARYAASNVPFSVLLHSALTTKQTELAQPKGRSAA